MANAVRKAVQESAYVANLLASLSRSTSNLDAVEDETMDEFKVRLTYWIGQMMFVAGETGDPSVETTSMIEEIVRQQVVEIVSEM